MESVFKFVEPKQEAAPQGLIKFFGLERWWLNEIEPYERKRIHDQYDPLGGSNKIDEGKVHSTSTTKVRFLQTLAGWFLSKEGDFELCQKILNKAEDSVTPYTSSTDLHFLYGRAVKFYYKHRKQGNNLQRAIFYCQKQIDNSAKAILSMQGEHKAMLKRLDEWGMPPRETPFYIPSHVGYYQLAVIYKKQQEWQKVIELCQQADEQGWAGDWQKRIAEAKQKLG
ncbi:hypothetical protein CTT31_20720 [Pseudoalteromonas maricaloris]|uniref:hypothetical protein n=1 Tax=Pseudoalteromonas maricaloris TaxID=184924 RepID=UPI0021AD78E7|nr:hypothetical protein [Pseudoalteromonas flavipulchra]USE71512.1 hypothetical protein CTT31_20720 [Pseudoalteromonas flavipulchra]